jgi:rhodanese-related sulfurtransferase
MKRILSLLIALVFCAGASVYADQVPRMDKDELKAMLGTDNLVILDVRLGKDWTASEFKIKDAIRVEEGDLSVANKYPKDTTTFVLYCA